MRTLVRTWLGFAAIGAGLIHLAVAAGAPAALLATFAVLGAAEVAWGIAALARGTVPLPRMALAGALLPIVVWVGLLLASAGSEHGAGHDGGTQDMHDSLGSSLPVGPMLAASLLDLGLAAVLAIRLRRGGPERASAEPGVWAYLGGVVGGAAVIFVLTSAALGGTAVGESAMRSMGH